MVFRDEALFEIEELDLRPFRVVEDFYEQIAQIHFDARLQLGQRFSVEVVVVLECDLAGVLVNLDQIGLGGIAVAMCGAVNVNAQNRRQLAKQAAMDDQRIFVLPTNIESFAG